MKRAVELASVVPADPEYVGALPPQKYLAVAAYDEATRKLGAGERLPGVKAVIEPAAQEQMNSSGFYTNGATFQCIANKAGNFGYFRSSNCSFSATVRTADGTGSGWAEDASSTDANDSARSAIFRQSFSLVTMVTPSAAR